MAASTNPAQEAFPELSIPALQKHAEIWMRKFHEAPIRRILLYRFLSPYEGEMADCFGEGFKSFPHIYAVVFELDAKDKTLQMNPEERMEYDRMKIERKRPLEPYERLLDATEPNTRRPYENRYRYFITAAFRDVYRDFIGDIDPYRKDWYFTLKFQNTTLSSNIRVDEQPVVLASNLEGLIAEAAPEVESLFVAIKEIGFSGRNPNANEKAWREAALEHFDRNKKRFRLVKRGYLEDEDLYAFADGQASRDFKGRLHQRVCEERGFGKQNYFELAKFHVNVQLHSRLSSTKSK